MPYIHNKGNPSSDTWVLVDKPLSGDIDRGYVYSSGLGYMWDKMMGEAGFNDYYVTCFRPDTDHPTAYANVVGSINQYQPKIIIPLDAAGRHFLPELSPTRRGKGFDPEKDSEIFKYAGSILTSEDIRYPHYCIPTLPPDIIARQYKLRDQVLLDLLKAKSELDHVKAHGILQPLPKRELKYTFESFDEILHTIDSFLEYPLISNDIETIYPRAGTKKNPSQFYGKLPGYPLTVGLAPTPDFGISIDLFRESDTESVELWRRLYNLFKSVPQLGQNFFNFDLNYYECLGFEFQIDKIQDTMIRHHILSPELPHKLQHLCRQYTREKYYKDEGAGWSPKNMDRLKRYNCLDVCITMEVWLEQEKEFEERPWIR